MSAPRLRLTRLPPVGHVPWQDEEPGTRRLDDGFSIPKACLLKAGIFDCPIP